MGIDSNKFQGNGVKIGILESGIPQALFGLSQSNVEFYATDECSYDLHSSVTGNIVAGTNGISENSKLYFAGMSNEMLHSGDNGLRLYECLNWLISSSRLVDIINISSGVGTGTYCGATFMIDYISTHSKVLFVVASGYRTTSQTLTNYLGNGVTTISVGSIDSNGKLSNFSSYGVDSNFPNQLVKPTLVVPGRIKNIGAVPNSTGGLFDNHHHGTSFSVP